MIAAYERLARHNTSVDGRIRAGLARPTRPAAKQQVKEPSGMAAEATGEK